MTPKYCVDNEILDALGPDDECPACGASEANGKPCGATNARPSPKALVSIVLVRKSS